MWIHVLLFTSIPYLSVKITRLFINLKIILIIESMTNYLRISHSFLSHYRYSLLELTHLPFDVEYV